MSSSDRDKQTTVQVKIPGRTVLDSVFRKLPTIFPWKQFRVTLIVPDNGIPLIEYQQKCPKKRKKKHIVFSELLFVDRKHDCNNKRFVFSIYTLSKTITFETKDEAIMNEWLGKISEYHSDLYPRFKKYDQIFEAELLDKGLGETMKIKGRHRVALCKESLDLIPVLNEFTELSGGTFVNPNHFSHNFTVRQKHQNFDWPPSLNSKIIELLIKSIRRCGHTDCVFYVEPGRQSQIGEGDLWMEFPKRAIARQIHEFLLANMKLASSKEDQHIHKTPRSRSGSSSENANKQTAHTSPIGKVSSATNFTDEDSDGYLPMS